MKKVLLVDDDAVILQIYRQKLQQVFLFETASDGLEAMKKMHSFKPDVVVLDIMMPKFNGLEVLNYIRSEPALKNLVVVVLSNMFIGSEQRQAATDKADLTLLKSTCSPGQLVEAINQILVATNADNPTPGSVGDTGGDTQL
jgi:two-component system, OmpR family, alkaline phosphatase synthesis response regulator PhoP